MHPLLLQLTALLFSIVPFSLLIIIYLPGFINRFSNKFGKTTVICTSIVGNLTKEPIEVRTILFDKFKARTEKDNHLIYLFNNQTQEEIRIEKKLLQNDPLINITATITALCHYEKIGHIEEVIGNFFKNCNIDLRQIKHEYDIIAPIPTNEHKKFSSVVAIKRESKEIFAFSKGNAKKILERCTRMFVDGKKVDITPQIRHKLKKRIEKLIKGGQKVLAFAYKPLPIKRLDHYSEQFAENDLVLISILGLVESINTELTPIILALKNRGIKIYILSSTKENKATAVAEQLKIINPHYFESLTNKDLEDIPEQKLSKLLQNKDKDYVFSELKKSSRLKIIEAFRKNGEVVTITNRKSGLTLEKIFQSIEKNHHLEKNYDSTIFHALNSKIPEIALALTALIFQTPPALTILSIIILDICINLPLEIFLKDNQLHDKNHKIKIPVIALMTGLVLVGIYLWNLIRFGWFPGESFFGNIAAIEGNNSLIFTLLALIQIAYAIQLKVHKKSVDIYLLLTGIIIILVIYSLKTFTVLKETFSFVDLSKSDWQIIIFSIFIITGIEELRKFIVKKSNGH